MIRTKLGLFPVGNCGDSHSSDNCSSGVKVEDTKRLYGSFASLP